MIRSIAVLSATLVSAPAPGTSGASAPRVGNTYEITHSRVSAERGSDGSSSSSTDRDTLVERVIGVRGAALELEYDLPQTATAQDRAGQWQLPVRILKNARGPVQLLDRAALAARVDPWLKSVGFT